MSGRTAPSRNLRPAITNEPYVCCLIWRSCRDYIRTYSSIPFATELLTAGNTIETVAALLGNSEAIVKKHYHHWVQARQERLEEAVKNSWAQLGTVEGSA
jgi:hypothetical protein